MPKLRRMSGRDVLAVFQGYWFPNRFPARQPCETPPDWPRRREADSDRAESSGNGHGTLRAILRQASRYVPS